MPAITPHTPIDQHMRDWRHDLHRHPETAYEETRTAAKIAALLHDFGLDEIHTGLAQTGVVGVLHGNRPGKTLGLRADMDALDIHEANTFAHRSQIAGKMHACGHDGHTDPGAQAGPADPGAQSGLRHARLRRKRRLHLPARRRKRRRRQTHVRRRPVHPLPGG